MRLLVRCDIQGRKTHAEAAHGLVLPLCECLCQAREVIEDLLMGDDVSLFEMTTCRGELLWPPTH